MHTHTHRHTSMHVHVQTRTNWHPNLGLLFEMVTLLTYERKWSFYFVLNCFHFISSILQTKFWPFPLCICVFSGMDTIMFNMDISYNFQSCIILHLHKQQSPDYNKSHPPSMLLCTATVCHTHNVISSWWIILTKCYNKTWVGFTVTVITEGFSVLSKRQSSTLLMVNKWQFMTIMQKMLYFISCPALLLGEGTHLPSKCERSSSPLFITVPMYWNDTCFLFPFQLKIFSPN